jgi:hypothetical protein
MPNELTIPPVRVSPTTTDSPKAATARPARVEPPAASVEPFLNPSLRLDAELGLVVIEFRDDSGTLTTSIPSERQMQAYRSHQETPPGRTAVAREQVAAPQREERAAERSEAAGTVDLPTAEPGKPVS